jgi:hypothetical protein
LGFMKAFIDVQQKRYNSQNLENMVSDYSFVTVFLNTFSRYGCCFESVLNFNNRINHKGFNCV